MLPAAGLAAPALAADPGGVPATPAPVSSAPVSSAPAKPKAPADAAPITARTSSVAYHGPVYVKTATGQVEPYTPVTEAAQQGAAAGGSAVPATQPGTGGSAASTGSTPSTVLLEPARPELLVPGSLARYVEGLAAAPMNAPAAVQEIIWAGNELIGLPYLYGGGHGSWISPGGYDCSGTVSFALHGANLLKMPEDSSEFEAFGSGGIGRWVTIFSNAGHAYMTVAGLRLDTSAADDPSNQQGPRWRPLRQSNAGFVVRHPTGL